MEDRPADLQRLIDQMAEAMQRLADLTARVERLERHDDHHDHV